MGSNPIWDSDFFSESSSNISLLSEYSRKFDFWYKLSYESGKRYKRVTTLRDMYSSGNDLQQSGGAPREETKDQDQRG